MYHGRDQLLYTEKVVLVISKVEKLINNMILLIVRNIWSLTKSKTQHQERQEKIVYVSFLLFSEWK